MRKTALLIVAVVILLISLFTFPVPAHENVSVYIDGKKIEFDVQPKIINGRTMVPMRKIFEELGATVEWDKATQTATAKKGNTVVKFIVNNYTMYKNEAASSLDVPTQLINDRTLIPLRAVSEAFDCQVGWDGSDCTVSIIDNSENYIMLYALNDRSKSFPADTIDAQLNVGWYTEPVQTLYAPGKSAVFKKSEIVAQLEVGWYTEPVQTLYALGKSAAFKMSEVESQLNAGWYKEPVYMVYANDGRSQVVTKSDLASWEKVGWSTTPFPANYLPAYAKNIQELISSCGRYWYSKNSSVVKGLKYGSLVDFERDNAPELLLMHDLKVSVYRYENGVSSKIYEEAIEDRFGQSDLSSTIALNQKSSIPYLITYHSENSWYESNIYVFTVKEGKPHVQKLFSSSNIPIDEPDFEGFNYFEADNSTVNEHTYLKIYNEVFNGAKEIDACYDSHSDDSGFPDICASQRELDAFLLQFGL